MGGFDRRRLLGLAAGVGAAGLTGALSACTATPSTGPKTPIRIGLLMPQTGKDKLIGQELQAGFELYLDMREQMFDGHKVELFRADETDNVESAVTALKGLLDKQVQAIVGIANPEVLRKAAPIVTDEKVQVPLLAAHASSIGMTSSVYVWRTSFVTIELGQAIGMYFKRKKISSSAVAVIGLSDANSAEVLEGFTNEFGSPGRSVVVPPPASGANIKDHLRLYFNDVIGKSPSMIFSYLPTDLMPAFYELLGDRKISVFAPGTVSEGDALKALGSRAHGLYTAMQYSPDLNNTTNRVFSERFESKHKKTPSAYAVASFDAAAVLDRAVSLIGNGAMTSQRINEELSNVGLVVSPRGNWQFTTPRNPQQKWYLRQIRFDGPIPSNVLIEELATLG